MSGDAHCKCKRRYLGVRAEQPFHRCTTPERTLPSTEEEAGPMDRQPLDLPSEVCSPSLKAKLFWETWGKLQGLERLKGSKGCRRITPKSSRTWKNLGLGLALQEFSLSNSTHTHSKFRLETVSDTGNSCGRSRHQRHCILGDLVLFMLGTEMKVESQGPWCHKAITLAASKVWCDV